MFFIRSVRALFDQTRGKQDAAAGEDEEVVQEVNRSPAAAKEISMRAAVGAVLSELDGNFFFYFKRRAKDGTEGFFSLDDMFWLCSRLALARILLNTAAHRSWPQGGDARLMSLLAPIESLELLTKLIGFALNVNLRRFVRSSPSSFSFFF